MNSKNSLVLALALAALVVLNGCGLFGGGRTETKPTPTLPFPTAIVVATVPAGATPAALEGKVALGGNVFIDSNGDGRKSDDEPIIAGVVVQLGTGQCPAGVLAVTTSTANTPSYRFESLERGDYCVSIDAASPQNAAILGTGEWTAPQTAAGTVSQDANLRRRDKNDVDFGWTFAIIGQVTPVPVQPTPEPGQPTPVEPTVVPPPLLPTPTAFVEPTSAPQACVYKAKHLEDVTVPDGQVMLPGTQFIKTWRVQNTGTCSWGPGSGLQNLQFISGDPLGAPNLVPIPNSIPAGAIGDLSINMTAPAQPGQYKSNWKLRADDGALIGVGPSNVALYALIRVQGAPPPTNVPPPTTIPPPPSVQPIQFAPGATEADVQGQLAANGIASYSVSAQEGQNMALSLSSNSSSARVAVLSPTGVPLPPQRGNPEGTYWQGTLLANGDYIIEVLAGNASPTANYSLNVTVPVRINFAPGTDSTQVLGTTSNGRIVTYLLKALSGQTMTVNLNAPPNSAGITIYGLEDGQPLIRSQSGATSFSGQLPATQDYVIQVVPFGNATVNYTLVITVQ